MIPLGLGFGAWETSSAVNSGAGRATCPGPWCSRKAATAWRAIRPSSMSWAWKNIVLFALMWWFSSKPRPLGQGSAVFLIGYGTFRFLVEFTREPDNFLEPARGRTEHGTVAVPADGGAGRHPVQPYCKTIVPLTATLTVTSPDSRGTSARCRQRRLASQPSPSCAASGRGRRSRQAQACSGGSPKIQKRWRRPAPVTEGLRRCASCAPRPRAQRDNKLMLEIAVLSGSFDASAAALEIRTPGLLRPARASRRDLARLLPVLGRTL